VSSNQTVSRVIEAISQPAKRATAVKTTTRLAPFALLVVTLLATAACESATDRTDGGGVLLTITDFDGLPEEVSVNNPQGGLCSSGQPLGCLVEVESLTLRNTLKDPTGVSSPLMDVQLKSYRVTFSRRDRGTRLPPVLVEGIFGITPAGGNNTINNLRLLTAEQLLSPPLSDLLFANGGVDDETGSTVIPLNVGLQFFGETLSGDAVATEVESFTLFMAP
jgi:hypothetical protein